MDLPGEGSARIAGTGSTIVDGPDLLETQNLYTNTVRARRDESRDNVGVSTEWYANAHA